MLLFLRQNLKCRLLRTYNSSCCSSRSGLVRSVPQFQSLSALPEAAEPPLLQTEDMPIDVANAVNPPRKRKGRGRNGNVILQGMNLPGWLKSIKFKDEEVLQLILKHPYVPSMAPDAEVETTLELLKSEGASLSKIRQMVLREPRALTKRKQIEAMLSFYQDFGGTRKECLNGVVQHPHMLRISMEDVIRPRMQYFVDFGLSSVGLRRILRNHVNLLGFPIATCIALKLECLENLGLAREKVLQIVERYPGILKKSVEARVESLLTMFSNMGVDLAGPDLGIIIRKFPSIFSCSMEHKIEPMLIFFRDSGFSDECVKKIVTIHPSILSLSLENQIKRKFYFVRDVLQKSTQEMAKNSDIFTYSFEDRILWRIALLQRGDKEYKTKSLGTLFGRSNEKFKNRLDSQQVASFQAHWDLLSESEKLTQVLRQIKTDQN